MESPVNYDTESSPFIIEASEGALNSWPCASWTLDEWAESYDQIQFKFRVHQKKLHTSTEVHWENEAESYVEATVAHLLEHVQAKSTSTEKNSNDANPFEAFPKEEYVFYSGYNYMNKLSPAKPSLLNSVRWTETGLFVGSRAIANDASQSTLWLGTSGSYTPCHMDTYGVNFVGQLQGRKRWILFPPSDTAHLYPVRIPFEESSIFSQVNFKCVDLSQFPLLKRTKPRVVELKAGEILFVPRHWWHFVENIGEDEMVSISINMWVTGNEEESSLSEALVQFLARPLVDAYGDASWINLDGDLFTSPEAGRILVALLNNLAVEDKEEMPEKETKRARRELPKRRHLPECTLEDVVQVKDGELVCKEEAKQIDLKDIVNCILDPQVIALIKSKLRSLQRR